MHIYKSHKKSNENSFQFNHGSNAVNSKCYGTRLLQEYQIRGRKNAPPR